MLNKLVGSRGCLINVAENRKIFANFAFSLSFPTTKLVRNNHNKNRLNLKDNILSEKKLSGNLGLKVKLHAEERLFPAVEECCELSVTCMRADYSASRICRAVEDADAHVLNLNVTSETLPTGEIVVDLRVSHRDAGAVSRSLERYGYTVTGVASGYDRMAEEMADRIGELMAHISI